MIIIVSNFDTETALFSSCRYILFKMGVDADKHVSKVFSFVCFVCCCCRCLFCQTKAPDLSTLALSCEETNSMLFSAHQLTQQQMGWVKVWLQPAVSTTECSFRASKKYRTRRILTRALFSLWLALPCIELKRHKPATANKQKGWVREQTNSKSGSDSS